MHVLRDQLLPNSDPPPLNDYISESSQAQFQFLSLICLKGTVSQQFLLAYKITLAHLINVSYVKNMTTLYKQVGPTPESNSILKRIFGQKIFGMKKVLGPKKSWIQKSCGYSS